MSLEKIQHIIKYIEEHYNQDISIQKLEQLSNYSYRNVQRVFKNIFNESLGAFQKRLKLENAYKKLIYTLDPITDVAYSVGFDSLQSFSKSFKKQFRYEACIDQETANKEFFSTHILGGRYAKYIHKGSYSLIEDTYRRIYRSWLFSSLLELDYSPIIEHYVKNDCNAENPDNYITEILVPLKKR